MDSKWMDERRMNRQRGRQTDRQTDIQTGTVRQAQSDGQTER